MAENITKNSSQSSAAAAAGSKGLTPDQFKVIGFTQEEANKIERPTISYWQDAWRRLRKNPVAMGALVVLGLLVIMVIIGPHIRGYDYINMNVVFQSLGGSPGIRDHRPGGHSSENGDRYPVWSRHGAFRRMGG